MPGLWFVLLGPEGGDLQLGAADLGPDRPELHPLQPLVLGHGTNDLEGGLGRSVGGEVQIDVRTPQEQVPDGAPDQVELVPFVPEQARELHDRRIVGQKFRRANEILSRSHA
jgi:hypothetical protein